MCLNNNYNNSYLHPNVSLDTRNNTIVSISNTFRYLNGKITINSFIVYYSASIDGQYGLKQ